MVVERGLLGEASDEVPDRDRPPEDEQGHEPAEDDGRARRGLRVGPAVPPGGEYYDRDRSEQPDHEVRRHDCRRPVVDCRFGRVEDEVRYRHGGEYRECGDRTDRGCWRLGQLFLRHARYFSGWVKKVGGRVGKVTCRGVETPVMGFGGTAKKIQKLADTAEKLYSKLNDLREQVAEMREQLDTTSERVETLERESAEQRALLEAIAEEQGIDTDDVAVESVDAGTDEADASEADSGESGDDAEAEA